MLGCKSQLLQGIIFFPSLCLNFHPVLSSSFWLLFRTGECWFLSLESSGWICKCYSVFGFLLWSQFSLHGCFPIGFQPGLFFSLGWGGCVTGLRQHLRCPRAYLMPDPQNQCQRWAQTFSPHGQPSAVPGCAGAGGNTCPHHSVWFCTGIWCIHGWLPLFPSSKHVFVFSPVA